MEKLFFLSVVCFLLTGCFGSKNKEYDYPQNNLRAPVSTSSAATANVLERKSSDMPQSITQPVQAAAQQPQSQPAQQPQQQMQQPLVQTIVIPQYTPYGPMPMQNMAMSGTMDINNFSAPNITASAPNMPMPYQNNAANTVNVPATPVNPSAIPVPQIKMPSAPAVQQNTTPKEAVYPAWAASDYTPPSGYNVADAMLYFKHPQYNETVQCAAVDSMCVNTYKQQGYQQVSGDNGFAQKQDAGYPRTPARESESNNIPRW